MAWQGRMVSDGETKRLMGAIARQLDSLNDMEALSAKVATADALEEGAYAFIFFNEDHQGRQIPESPPDGSWTTHSEVANNEAEYEQMILNIGQKLNELESESYRQAFFAKFVACNAKYDTGHFSLLIPPK